MHPDEVRSRERVFRLQISQMSLEGSLLGKRGFREARLQLTTYFLVVRRTCSGRRRVFFCVFTDFHHKEEGQWPWHLRM